MILCVDKVLNYLARKYRSLVFYKKTGYRVNLVGKITLINRNLIIGNNVFIYPDVMFVGDGRIEIGNNVAIGNGTIIYASKSAGVSIGDNSMIAAQCYIIDVDHGIKAGVNIKNQENSYAPVHIGNDCWIAAGAKILKGSNIHDGAVIGAQSVVKGEVAENAIAVGVPAKVIKFRS